MWFFFLSGLSSNLTDEDIKWFDVDDVDDEVKFFTIQKSFLFFWEGDVTSALQIILTVWVHHDQQEARRCDPGLREKWNLRFVFVSPK